MCITKTFDYIITFIILTIVKVIFIINRIHGLIANIFTYCLPNLMHHFYYYHILMD